MHSGAHSKVSQQVSKQKLAHFKAILFYFTGKCSENHSD